MSTSLSSRRSSDTSSHLCKCLFKNESAAGGAPRNVHFYILIMLVILISHVDGFVSSGLKARLRHDKLFTSTCTRSRISASIAADDQMNTHSEEESSQVSSSISIDPLLFNALQTQSSSSFGAGFNLSLASSGIRTWRTCLCKGRFPLDVDFDQNVNVWPAEPFFSKVTDAMTTLQLPRFVLRHPDTVSAVLLTLLRLTFKFMEDVRAKEEEKEEDANSDEEYEDDAEIYADDEFTIESDQRLQDTVDDVFSLSSEEMDAMATEIADSLIQEWNGVVSGVNLLDQLFGYDHDMLDVNIQEDENSSGDAMAGFGLEDGIWKHTGWREIPALQNQIASMQELQELMKAIGRRPTAENSNEIHKFSPRKLQNDGAVGAQFDPQMRESVSGITLSGSLTEMLPSEAVLLRGSSGALRRLFMAKKAESKLLSYEMSGWTDVPSTPLTKPLYLKRMPSAAGGPIIVCLDTSWSMSGMREQLSKAVVLACATMAHKQRRDCQVVAFSTERGVMEAGIITPDGEGVQRLLGFLSHSFEGGTDVTGALKYAMETLDSDIMSAADILMISDGEIPDPPVSNKIMEALDRLKLRKGVEVHGLLVGKKESKALSRLCTEVHNFLADYDTQLVLGDGRLVGTTTALQIASSQLSIRPGRRGPFGFTRFNTQRNTFSALQAKYSKYDDGDSRVRKRNKKGRNKKWDAEDGDEYMVQSTQGTKEEYDNEEDGIAETRVDSFVSDLEEFTKTLKLAASESLVAEAWKPEILLAERESEGSCWKYREELKAAVETVSEGLVERQEEARLVVLAMLSMEHILLLGVPGTGKSILGRRLSKLCNGAFFQRLLTKFSTPEELFGPLSLKSLEEDEYRRCTAGFLPTASIAFLDEIFKANSAILNTLLTILNERRFDNAGGQEVCPIRCVVGASNELPESDELVALFDRFLIRKEVLPVSDEGVINLLTMSNPGCNMETDKSCDVIFTEDLDRVIADLSIAADSVHMAVDTCELMRDLRTFMREAHSVEISDRRLVKSGRLLKISAASQGRTVVDPIDCLLLQHCMWHVPDQKAIVRDWLWDNITPGGQINQFRLLLDTLRGEISDIIRKTSGDVTGEFGGRKGDIDVINSLRSEINRITSILQKNQSDLARHMELLRHAENCLWLDLDEMKSLQQLLLPRAEKASIEVDKALTDCRSLELCLGESDNAPSNELRLSVIQDLWKEGYTSEITFTDEEMNIGMKEAKNKYDLETFRKWKRAKKRAEK
jgi:MoxR-like ATPase